jgi:hypothetical protein
MSLRILDVQQRSPEWYEARRGIVTASSVGDLVAVCAPDAIEVDCSNCGAVAGEPCLSAARKTPTPIKTFHGERTAKASSLPPVYGLADNDTSRGLLDLLAAERITGHIEDTYTSRDMERGVFAEPFARDLYAEHTERPVEECGFMVREFDGFKIGYSPDGLVGHDGLIEIKAPRQKRELRTILNGEVPAEHIPQLQCGLLVSGRSWIDFVSYCGGMPLWVQRVTPDPAWQAAIVAAAERAERTIAETVATFRTATVGLPVAERIDLMQEIY